jgi:Na+/H+ antiporter NhaD/arsenite permease-like protein
MITTLVVIFVLAYAAIALEHPLRINKSASALLGAGALWVVYALVAPHGTPVSAELNESLTSTAQIVFFLLGAMTIVEVIDAHDGFVVITDRIKTDKLSSLAWLVGTVTFFLSSILDNLTTTIVMVSLMKKLLEKREDRLFFAGIIIIAANAGGAWTPIGDVTTTMLWIGGQVTTVAIMSKLFVPSLINLLVPLTVIAYSLHGQVVVSPARKTQDDAESTTPFERQLMFYLGLGILVLVPVFKTITHLPPYMGILLGLGLLWAVGDWVHQSKPEDERMELSLVSALTRIDMSAVVFFIGILLAVACLEHTHVLAGLAQWLTEAVSRQDIIVLIIGLVSAVVDNVPLVAASMGMFSLAEYPIDSFLWLFLAYCAGTGGSILIIGSAAGVAAMGLERIEFMWYARKIGGLALLGYFAGAAWYVAQNQWFA